MFEFYNHLIQRCKNYPEIFGVVDHENEIFTRYIYNLSGEIIGYQRYNWRADKFKNNDPKGRYYTYVSKVDNKTELCVMGLETFDSRRHIIYVVEGGFEQASAVSCGFNCVATLTNTTKRIDGWLKTNHLTSVALCQPDKASMLLARNTDYHIVLPKDLDDLTYDELQELIKTENWIK